MKKYGLGKKDKLCSVRAIEQLFGAGGAEFSTLAYPLRALARTDNMRSSDAAIAFFISVPKKRLRHAVDRVAMRRRVREAYRLNRCNYPLPEGVRLDVAFVYVADRLKSYRSVERAMTRILGALAAHYAAENPASTSPDNEISQ